MVMPVSLTGDGRHRGIITSSREIYCVPSPRVAWRRRPNQEKKYAREEPSTVTNQGMIQFVNVPHCEAIRSAPRCDSAKIVNVGFEAPSVGKMPGPATQRFGISWLWP